MEQLKTIETMADIELLVNSFYGKVRNDEMLKNIFNDVIGNNWPQHLEKMYRFWQTVLLEEPAYYGSPFMAHVNLPVDKQHFDHWIKLFCETVDEQFMGKRAERAKWHGRRMAEMFLSKIQYYKNNPSIPLL